MCMFGALSDFLCILCLGSIRGDPVYTQTNNRPAGSFVWWKASQGSRCVCTRVCMSQQDASLEEHQAMGVERVPLTQSDSPSRVHTVRGQVRDCFGLCMRQLKLWWWIFIWFVLVLGFKKEKKIHWVTIIISPSHQEIWLLSSHKMKKKKLLCVEKMTVLVKIISALNMYFSVINLLDCASTDDIPRWPIRWHPKHYVAEMH